MVELIILSVVVAALVIAGVWYLLVRRSANEPARRAVEPVATIDDRPIEPVETPEPDPSSSLGTVEEDSATVDDRLIEPVEAPVPDSVTVAEPDHEASATDPSSGSGIVAEGSGIVGDEAPVGVLSPDAVRLAGTATNKEAAIAEVGELLVKVGAVEPGYVDSMLARERSVSTYMGNLLAIPHGTNAAQDLIRRSAIAVVRYPDGIDWNGNSAQFVVGIAGADDQHVRILSGIAGIFLDPPSVASLTAATSVAEVMAIFAPVDEGL